MLLPVGVAVSFLGVLLITNTAGASRNDAEQNAENLCYSSGLPDRRGAIWMNNSESNYFEDSVNVDGDASSAAVKIRGSIFSCRRADLNHVWATHVSAGGTGHGWRLTGIMGTYFYRGSTNGIYQWSQWGGSLNATLNITGLATNYDSNGVARQTITVPIYRCFVGSASSSFPGQGPSSGYSCYAEDIKVNIKRTRPIKWTIEPKTWLGTCTGNCNSNPDDTTNNRWTEYTGVASSANPFKPSIGDRVQWWHSAKNTGPSSTNYNVYWYKSYSSSGDARSPSNDSWRREPGLAVNSETASKLGDEIVIGQAHVGNTICNATTIWPRNQSLVGQSHSMGYYTGAQKCIYVPYNFNLVPSITIPGGNVVEPGSGTKTNITGNIKNDGPTKSRPDGKWQISKIVFNKTPTTEQKKTGDSSSNACSWSQYSSGKKSCTKTQEGAWSDPISNGGNFSSNIKDEFEAGDEPVGTTVCYVLSISPFKEGSSGWRHSSLQCLTYGKKPKVQVWGGDVVVGRSIDGATAANSDIGTSLSVKRRVRTESSPKTVPATVGGSSSNDISGLWKTGVDNNNAKVPANRNDAHWQVRTVFNDSNKSTCAKGYRQDGSIAGPSPGANIGNVNWQAVTVGELSDKLSNWPTTTTGGLISGSSGLSNTHFATIAGDTFGAPRYIWNLARPDARWVGLNQYAHDYSSSSCVSPTKSAPGTDMTNANTTVFSLKGGINVSNEVDLDTVSFKMNLAADNLVKFFVNGKELKAASGAKMNTSHGTNWQEPGWLAGSWAGATAKTVTGENAFKHGNNTFEVYVKSTYTSTGMILYDFNFDAMKKVVVQNQVNEDVVYGSWGEYALVANGQIKGMASGAAFHPSGTNSTAQGNWSSLTFANTFSTNPTGGCTTASPWGCYAHKSSMPKVESLFSAGTNISGTVATVDTNSLKGKVNTKTGGTINITGGTLGVGEWAVINAPTSTVNITENLSYSNNTISNINNIPQMIIIANNININSDVTRVDSWLIAKNALATCDAKGHAAQLNTTSSGFDLSSEDCKKQLLVNGPVMAKKLWLRRTAGAGTGDSTGNPAEIFNYRPDAMLWLNSRFNNKALRTTNITELPPRY